jgi:hypothetical protein
MEKLTLELIEAYRRNEEQGNPTPEAGLLPSEEVIAVHHSITQHRVDCPVCFRIHHSQAIAHIGPLHLSN